VFRYPFIALLLLLCSCRDRYVVVYNDYITPSYLASSYVDAPDPRKCCEFCGQRLVIRWRLSKGELYGCESAYIRLLLRFGCAEVEEVCIPMGKRFGTYVYWLMNEDYREKDGILTYKVEMVVDDEVVDVWEHQVWTELIDIDL
jgi:hypothetical protein